MNTTLSNYLLEIITKIADEINNDENIDYTTANHYGCKLDTLMCEIIDNTDYSTLPF